MYYETYFMDTLIKTNLMLVCFFYILDQNIQTDLR